MQTFLPYPSFEESAQCLDYKRLGKQRVEADQILNILIGKTTTRGWRNHPITIMWKRYPYALAEYRNCMIKEWIKRGYKNTMPLYRLPKEYPLPHWLGGEIHTNHRANLLRKDPIYYGKFNWQEQPLDIYYYPR